jgi:hypothetical protein
LTRPNIFVRDKSILSSERTLHEDYHRKGSVERDQTLAELIQAGGEIMGYKIHKLINSIWNKEELPVQWKESSILPVNK